MLPQPSRVLLSQANDYALSMMGEPDRDLQKIKLYGTQFHVPIVRDDVGGFLKLITSLQQPKRILEIGSGIGYSTLWMLKGWPQAKITALDCNQDRAEKCQAFLNESGFGDQVEVKAQWAEEFFKSNTEQFDLIFQDATKKSYVDHLEPCIERLKPKGLLIADNLFYNGKLLCLLPEQEKKYAKPVEAMKRFNASVAEHPQLESLFLAFCDGLLIAQKK